MKKGRRVPSSEFQAPSLERGTFSELDRHFARFVERLAGGSQPELALAAALASYHRSQGHICLDLASVAGKPWPDSDASKGETVGCPDLENWLQALRATPVVGAPGEFKPLILDAHHRLYLHRYWEYETSLAGAIRERAAAVEPCDEARLRAALDRLFPVKTATGETGLSDEPDGQRAAAETAARRRLCVISGGPGTGKTRTLAHILALLLELAVADGRRLRCAVAAPTGKAAARVQEEIRKAKEQLPCAAAVLARLPEEAMTLHRLLEATPDSATVRRNAKNPLAADVVVVDEVSMVDLALMAKLFAAVPLSAKVILLGDKDQLASVEAGAVLGDICAGADSAASGRRDSPLASCVVELRKNFRFRKTSAIARLTTAVNGGDADAALGVLRENAQSGGEVAWTPLPGAAGLKAALRETLLAGFGPYLNATEPGAALVALARFRVLCAVREGPFGVAHLNELAEEILEEAGLIRRAGPWYSHRPVMVTRNDYGLRLFNGDTGAILPDARTSRPRAFFAGPEQAARELSPARLPVHETVYAMTVHKSQGSEFERVLLVLPDRDGPLLTRELLYTGLTRARSHVELWADESVLRAAVARRVERNSGFRDALWKTT